MADFRNNQYQTGAAERASVEYDAGLRSYMMRVYNYMSVGLALTGVVAMATAYLAQTNEAVFQALYLSPLKWVVMFAPLGFIFFLGAKMNSMSVSKAQTMFWAFAALMGVSMSTIFLIYTSTSIAQTFFVTAAAFAGLSLYGYTTKRSLSGMGSFLVMGVIGLIIASVVNIFLASSALHFAISAIGVLIFAGLTAYDTQKIKLMYDQVAGNEELMGRTAIMGALNLYLDFINMFQFLLAFMGGRE